jgi:GntR family transcriptional regulator
MARRAIAALGGRVAVTGQHLVRLIAAKRVGRRCPAFSTIGASLMLDELLSKSTGELLIRISGVQTLAIAKYLDIADDLRERLGTGSLPLEQEAQGGPLKLPGEKELASEYGASRSTIRLALQVLANQGLVQTRHGLGTFVLERRPPLVVPLDHEEDWQAGQHAETALFPVGSPSAAQTTGRFQVETVQAGPEVADFLSVSEGDQVVLRRSRQHIDGKPWCLVVSYYPMDIAGGTELEHARRLSASSSQVLAGLHHEVVRYTESISVRMPDPIETGFFRSTGTVPVIILSRTAHDRGRPVRVTRYIFRGDQVRLVLDRPARHTLDSGAHS